MIARRRTGCHPQSQVRGGAAVAPRRYAAGVKRSWLLLVVGGVAILIGVVWTLQGVGSLGGSAMTGERIWAVIGPLVALAGLVAVAVALRTRRR